MQYSLLVNGKAINIDEKEIDDLDLVENSKTGTYHLLLGGKAYVIDPVNATPSHNDQTLTVNGSTYHIHIADEIDQLVHELGMDQAMDNGISNIESPMPGLVLDIMVQVGDHVQAGQSLCILEAMKMENILKAAGEGTVKQIHVSKGQPVDKGQLIIEWATPEN